MTDSTSRYTYYSTRSAAKAAAKATAGLKFSDRGANKTKGNRWATYVAADATAPVTLETTAASPKKTVRASSASNKKTKAVKAIVRMMGNGKTRQQILKHLVDKCDLTAPGASTYYANVKNGTWS